MEPRPSVDDIKQKQSSTRGEALREVSRKDKKIQAESAVAARQSAVREKNHTKQIISEKGAFAHMRSRCKARAKINRRRIFDTLRINFCAATPQMPSDVQKQAEVDVCTVHDSRQ